MLPNIKLEKLVCLFPHPSSAKLKDKMCILNKNKQTKKDQSVQVMIEGPILFGLDKNTNPLFVKRKLGYSGNINFKAT